MVEPVDPIPGPPGMPSRPEVLREAAFLLDEAYRLSRVQVQTSAQDSAIVINRVQFLKGKTRARLAVKFSEAIAPLAADLVREAEALVQPAGPQAHPAEDASGTPLKVGDKVMIPAVVTDLCEGNPDYCNVGVETTLGRRPDGLKERISAINTAQPVKIGRAHV